jgi:hypothetical protein
MNTEKDNNEIFDLLILLLEDDLKDFQKERLIEWSQADPDAPKKYADFSSYYSIISIEIASGVDPEVGSSSDSQFDQALCQAVNSGSPGDMDSNVSLDGFDTTEVLSNKKEDTVAGFPASMDNNIMQAFQELAEVEETAPTVEIPKEEVAEEAGPVVVRPARVNKPASKFQIFTLITGVAAVLFLALFIKFVPEALPSIEVATLTDQMNVQWGDSGFNYENGERLLTNDFPFDLKKGFVSIEYDEGVEVVVEGPALFEIQRSGVYLEYGRLYSKVTDAGLGFTVRTPTSQFVDQGTEFGVKADIDGSSELHVTKGKVQLFAGIKGISRASQMVTEDEAVRYDAENGRLKNIRIKTDAFVRKINSAFNLIWTDSSFYEQAVIKTKPVAYYRFEKGQDALGYDEMSGSVTPCDYSEAVTFAPGPASTSEDGNQSLYLSGDADSGIFLSDKAVIQGGGRALSISLWIQPGPAMDGQRSIISFTDHEKSISREMTNQLYLTSDNRVGFYVYNIFNTQVPIPFTDWDVLSRENTRPFVLKTLEPLPDNEWSHVVACFSDQKIELYVNGQLSETKPIPIRSACYQGGYWGIGCLTNARRNQTTAETNKLSYKGGLDELSFYDRKISAQEVRLLYDAAKPLR